jgi:hypothetical protein
MQTLQHLRDQRHGPVNQQRRDDRVVNAYAARLPGTAVVAVRKSAGRPATSAIACSL